MLESRIAAALSAVVPDNTPLLIAYSGGLDSTVLLHALVNTPRAARVRAVHVDHGLHPDSARWAEHCQVQCAQWGVECVSLPVTVERPRGTSLEAQARAARYAAIANERRADECVVTAHHQQDQLETVLLALMRGAGVRGLAAMPAEIERNGMRLLRPLLDISRDELSAAAEQAGLQWLDDPSNTDQSYDRNYLRHSVSPALERRWPAAARGATRSARLLADAMAILDDVAATDIEGALTSNCLRMESLMPLSAGRQRNAFRWVCQRLALPLPSETQLNEALQALLGARVDAAPLAAWPGVRVRRYRDGLWFYSAEADPGALPSDDVDRLWRPQEVLQLGPVRGELSLAAQAGPGIAVDRLAGGLRVGFRRGGEQLRPEPAACRRDLKKLLQERNVLPWMRSHIPLIYLDDELLAVGDLWTNADHSALVGAGGKQIRWTGHMPLQAPG
jgi:tRNA(Ile)-lysidine synthase